MGVNFRLNGQNHPKIHGMCRKIRLDKIRSSARPHRNDDVGPAFDRGGRDKPHETPNVSLPTEPI